MRRTSVTDAPVKDFKWHVLKLLLPYLKEYKYRVLLALSCLIVTKMATVYMPFVLKDLVDTLNVDNVSNMVALPLGLIVAYGLVRLSSTLFAEIRDTLFNKVTERAIRRISLAVFSHLHKLDLNFHLNRQTGGLSRDIERGTSGISFLMRFMIFNIVPTLFEIVMVVGILFVNYGASFALTTLSAVVIYIIYSVIATNWRTGFVREANVADSKSNTRAIDSLLNYETVKYFTNETKEADFYDKELATWEKAKTKNRLSLFVLNGGQAIIISVAMSVMLALAAKSVTTSDMTIGDFVLVNAFMMQLFMPLNFLGFVYREIKGSLANIEQMFTLLTAKPAIVDHESAVKLAVSSGCVEFKHVSFNYQSQRNIIKNLQLTLPAGKTVAIVGASGSGKSTLVKLLFRFYDVTDGNILIDGQDIRDVTQHSLRSSIGIVPQDTVLFNDSIMENIRYGRPNASDDEVWQAIEMAHLKAFILSLPQQELTTVGERGLKLSGGEKQRVAIARTLLKQPDILVFDEATSSLDSNAEQAIIAALNEVSKGRTTLVIAHRLSTVVNADTIVVLQAGEIVEQGTHGELIARQGAYYQLWQMQQDKAQSSEI